MPDACWQTLAALDGRRCCRGVLGVGRWACSGCRSDIFVTIRAARPAYTALMFIGPPLAGIAAEMPLLVSLHEHLISYLMFTESGEAESLLCTLMQFCRSDSRIPSFSNVEWYPSTCSAVMLNVQG